MGIRTLLSRSASGVALTPVASVPAFAAAASTVRVPAGRSTALRRTAADLRQRLAHGWWPTGPVGVAAVSAAPGPTGREAPRPVTALPAVTGLAAVTHLPAVPDLTGRTAATAPRTGTPDAPGRTSRPWAELARGYLTLVLTLLPRPRPAHTTITVYIATTDNSLSERPDGSAPPRRPGRNRRGPEPDATP